LSELSIAKMKGRTTTVPWVKLEEWFAELVSQRVINPENTKDEQKTVFWGFMSRLRDLREIKVRGEGVCIPL